MTADQFLAMSLTDRAQWLGTTPDDDADKLALSVRARTGTSTRDRGLAFEMGAAEQEWTRMLRRDAEDRRNRRAL